MPRGIKGASPTPELAARAAKSRAYYAEHKAAISWQSNAWNRTHREAGRERSRRWPKEHPERARELRNIWTATNRERSRVIQKSWYEKHPGYNTRKSIEHYVHKQEKLAGRKRPKRCDVCRKHGRRKICFDRCHKDNHFRGWICDNCNTALGHVHDSAVILRRLADYLDNDKLKQKERKNAKAKK